MPALRTLTGASRRSQLRSLDSTLTTLTSVTRFSVKLSHVKSAQSGSGGKGRRKQAPKKQIFFSRIGSEVSNISYCQCKDSPSSVYGRLSEDCDWTPFIERKDILVWRREHPARKGMYEYKMYGSFDDVTAEEFLSVQLDMSEFRLTWDKSTAQVGLT